jgi:tellurite resistance protein
MNAFLPRGFIMQHLSSALSRAALARDASGRGPAFNAEAAVEPLDDDEMTPDGALVEDDPIVSDVCVMIDYVSSKLEHTRRRVTMSCLKGAGPALAVRCWCHERAAPRTFRLDRIACFISPDGELIEPRDFWPSIGLPVARVPPFAAPGSIPEITDAPVAVLVDFDEGPESARLAVRSAVRHQMRILAALSRSDGLMKPSEIEAIVQYAMIEGEMAGRYLDEAETAELSGYIRRLRPSAEKVAESAEALFAPGGLDGRPLFRFWRAAKAVVDADGIFAPEEFEFLRDLQEFIDQRGA